MKSLEHDEQTALFTWAAYMENQIPQLKSLFAIPNGGHRHKAVAAKLKAEGVKAGVPDIFLAVPMVRNKKITNDVNGLLEWGEWISGLFIEMKAGKNKTTESQDEWIERLSKAGYRVAVCYGFEEAKREILDYLEVKE